MRLAIVLFAAFALAAPALAQEKPPARVDLENAADGTRITLKRGGELRLLLDGEPVRRQRWEVDGSVGPVLSQIGDRATVSKSVNPIDLTAGQWNIFGYRAEQAGKVTIKLNLRAPQEPTVKTVRYEVVVE